MSNVIRVTVDHEKCIGSGQCSVKAPDAFDQRDEDGKVVVLLPLPPADQLDAVREAVTCCPTGAITIDEA